MGLFARYLLAAASAAARGQRDLALENIATRHQVEGLTRVALMHALTLHWRQSRNHSGRRAERRAHGRRGAMAVSLDEPPPLVAVPEGEEGEAQLLHGLEVFHPQQLLLERTDEALRAAIALGRSRAHRVRYP